MDKLVFRVHMIERDDTMTAKHCTRKARVDHHFDHGRSYCILPELSTGRYPWLSIQRPVVFCSGSLPTLPSLLRTLCSFPRPPRILSYPLSVARPLLRPLDPLRAPVCARNIGSRKCSLIRSIRQQLHPEPP